MTSCCMKSPKMTLILLFLAAVIGQNLALVTKPTSVCGLNPVNIHFLLDGSNSVEQTNFNKMLTFVQGFINPFTIGPSDAQFGLTTFEFKAHEEFWLNSYFDKNSLLSIVGTVKFPGGSYTTGGTYAHIGLDFCRQQAFTPAHGGRPGVQDVLIVITDGEFNKPALAWDAATKVHQSMIKVLGVGVGDKVNYTAVRHLSSDEKRFFHVNNWDALNYIMDDLRNQACEVCEFWKDTNAVYIDGRCIRFFPEEKSWDDAKTACEQQGGPNDPVRLLRIVSEEIRAYVQEVVSKDGRRIWVDGNDKYIEGIFAFYDRSPANFPLSWWGTGQPDDSSGNEDCVLMRPDKMLNDYYCGGKAPFLCEAMEVREAL